MLKWFIRVVWEYNQTQRELWRVEVEKGKTPDECKYIKNEIVLSEMMLNDLGYYSQEEG